MGSVLKNGSRVIGEHRSPAGKRMKAALGLDRGSLRAKRKWRDESRLDGLSLKQYVREKLDTFDEELRQFAENWLHNKSVRTKSPPLGIGRTNGKRSAKGQSPKKKEEKGRR